MNPFKVGDRVRFKLGTRGKSGGPYNGDSDDFDHVIMMDRGGDVYRVTSNYDIGSKHGGWACYGRHLELVDDAKMYINEDWS